ncbi:unnamed protein product [Citrullus colocynthis]|uniref:Uncharacterized protein n=1 Tax=Citrullus colocynthis TaxID=252529 RepID=A0ABP0YZV2_9ROSI
MRRFSFYTDDISRLFLPCPPQNIPSWEPVSRSSPPKVALTEGSGLHSMECFVGSAQGVRFFGLVWREALFVDLSGDML